MESLGDRREALRDLVSLRVPLSSALDAVRDLPWDSDETLVTLTRADATRVLEKFLAGGLDAEEVEAWANALESREDVAFEDIILELVFELANPVITAPLTDARARYWITVV